VRLELRILLHVVGKAEGDAGGLVQGRLNRDDVVHFRLKRLEHSVELPAASTALVDDKFDLRLEGSQWLEPQIEQDWFVGRRDALRPLVDEDKPIDEALVRWVEHIDLKVELVVWLNNV